MENNETKAMNLFKALGLHRYTQRHLSIVISFIANNGDNAQELLGQLGSYDADDVLITELWLKQLSNEG